MTSLVYQRKSHAVPAVFVFRYSTKKKLFQLFSCDRIFLVVGMNKRCGAFRRVSKRATFWFRYKVVKRIRLIVVAFVFTLLVLLHFVLLPSVSGAYNDDCYLSERKLNELRYLIVVSAKLMEKYNMTYWLDFGTLLGAVKYGDVLPWDGDADISSIYHKSFNPFLMNKEFASYGIHRNALVAIVNHSQLDYYRWTVTSGVFSGIKETLLKKYYPDWILKNENIFVKLEHNQESVPLSWVVPTQKINFQGVQVSVPKEYEKFLEARYPLTYKYNIFTPYKWKCWLPCWLTTDQNCRRHLTS